LVDHQGFEPWTP